MRRPEGIGRRRAAGWNGEGPRLLPRPRELLLAGAASLADPGALLGSAAGLEAASGSAQAGFLWGALFLTAAPYLVLAAVGGGLYYAHRKAVRREVEAFLRSQEEGLHAVGTGPRTEER